MAPWYIEIPRTIVIAAILVEAFFVSRDARQDARLKDFYASVTVGLLFGLITSFTNGSLFIAFERVHAWSMIKIPTTWYTCILIFLLLDLTHYLIHWLEHRLRIFWLFHSIHHSSKYYNFSTAIRGPLATAIYRLLYVGPLCLLGFDPTTVFILDQMIILYAFFLHTERIGKLGLLEHFMNTPSHHRVHHSSNKEYLDKNFGACLIIWDKLFGTFAEEKTRPVYGLTTPLESHNPLRIVAHEWLLLWCDLRLTGGIKNAIQMLLNYPGWTRMINSRKDDVKKIRYAFITISLLVTIVQVSF